MPRFAACCASLLGPRRSRSSLKAKFDSQAMRKGHKKSVIALAHVNGCPKARLLDGEKAGFILFGSRMLAWLREKGGRRVADGDLGCWSLYKAVIVEKRWHGNGPPSPASLMTAPRPTLCH